MIQAILSGTSSTVFWVIPGVLVVFWLGYGLGRALGRHERKATLKALKAILETADEFSIDVGTQNTELATMERSVEEMPGGDEMGDVQMRLLTHIHQAIESNHKMEDDLVCARYQMEEQAQELDRTRHEARTDTLSGVANRKAFDETLHYWLSRSNRKSDRFALLIADIDHFKRINDTHGHQAGDNVVRGVGALMKKQLRAKDYVARYGGDEFVLLLRAVDLETALKTSERIRRAGEQQTFSTANYGERVAITFSMGVTMARKGDTPDSILGRADHALYNAKEAGRNCLRAASEDQPKIAPPIPA